MNENTSNVNAVATRTAAPPARSAKNDVRSLLTRYRSEIGAALPKHITPDRMMRVALTAINSTPKLLNCTQESLMQCVLTCASLGLEPGATMGHAYLIPYKETCTLIIGYKGLLDLARRSGQVLTISANNVYSNEKFIRVEGMERNLEHIPLPPSQRGDYIGTYAVAKLRDDSFHFEWLWAEEVEQIAKDALSRAYKPEESPWRKFPSEMRRKTAVRRLVKYLPISVELSRAASIDEAHELGLPTADLDLAEFTVQDAPPVAPTIEKALSSAPVDKPAEKPIEKHAPAPSTADVIKNIPADAPKAEEEAASPEATDAIRGQVKLAASRKGLNNGKLLQAIGMAIGKARPVVDLTADECARVLDVIG